MDIITTPPHPDPLPTGERVRVVFQCPECQKFYDETAGIRKELHNKEFEYFEAARNPKTTGEALMKIEKEVRELQEKIYAKGPIGCWQ
jgi:hypothetical protein